MNLRSLSHESPVTIDDEAVTPRRGRGRPKRRLQSLMSLGQTPVTSGVCQVPVRLREQLTALAAAFLQTVLRQLESAYAIGIEAEIVNVLDTTLPDAALALGRASMEALLVQERGFHGSTLSCHRCNGELRYQGDVVKSIKTRMGDVVMKRSYYYGSCGHSVSPLDVLLGVDGAHAVLPSLQDTVAWMTASMSFPETVKVLAKLCPSKFSLKAVEAISATIASQVQKAHADDCVAGTLAYMEDDGKLEPGVAILEVDGGFVSVRDHTEPSREFKLAVLGTLAHRDVAPNLHTEPGEIDKGIKLVDKSFVGHFSDPDTVFDHIQTEYRRRGLYKFKKLHGISDGGKWIMPRMEFIVDEGQELSLVLDWWHADERLAQASNAFYGHGAKDSEQWRIQARSDLWNGRLDEFFHLFQQAIFSATTPEATKALQEHHAYFASRRHLLRYKECREEGLPIGSGAIEGGIRFIGKDRLDRTGMRWNISGAEAILQLRCIKYSNRWDELATKRAAKRRSRYIAAQAAWYKAA